MCKSDDRLLGLSVKEDAGRWLQWVMTELSTLLFLMFTQLLIHLLNVQQRSRTHGLFLRRVFRCPKLQKESLQFRRATISAVASPAAMSCSSSTTPPSLSDHILDRVSCFLLIRGKELLGSTKLDQALDWLPPKLLEQLHRKEAFVRQSDLFSSCEWPQLF